MFNIGVSVKQMERNILLEIFMYLSIVWTTSKWIQLIVHFYTKLFNLTVKLIKGEGIIHLLIILRV
jgi:hypothetical protein